MTEPLGLYVHIPFCASICNYCNFNRGLFDADLKRRYVGALIEEIRRGDGSPADTIFFGGGTPSLLEPSDVGALIAACRESFAVSAEAEVTLEANPDSVTIDRLAGYRQAGVTRVSFGVQSFRDAELLRLGRTHDARGAATALAMARAAGFDNVSLDLMMWLPGQSPDEWLESVDTLIALRPDHASVYMLELYPNAPLREEMARARWTQAPDDDVAHMYLSAMDRMERAGLAQYEISNVARAGCASRHNLKYWSDGEWVGFGCGAHSTRGGARWKNVASTVDYVDLMARGSPAAIDVRVMSRQEQLEDALFMGLRRSGGVDLASVGSRYDIDVWSYYGPQLTPYLDEGLLIYDGGALRLSRPGMLLAHEVMMVFISPDVR
ncbi:MAG: radical SAM family heme chaperone HemW [Vicinamibacterales bacterium]